MNMYKINIGSLDLITKEILIESCVDMGFNRGEKISSEMYPYLLGSKYIIIDITQPLRWTNKKRVYDDLHNDYLEITPVEFFMLRSKPMDCLIKEISQEVFEIKSILKGVNNGSVLL